MLSDFSSKPFLMKAILDLMGCISISEWIDKQVAKSGGILRGEWAEVKKWLRIENTAVQLWSARVFLGDFMQIGKLSILEERN